MIRNLRTFLIKARCNGGIPQGVGDSHQPMMVSGAHEADPAAGPVAYQELALQSLAKPYSSSYNTKQHLHRMGRASAKHNVVPRIDLRAATAIDWNDFVFADARLTDRAKLTLRLQPSPFVDAWPTEAFRQPMVMCSEPDWAH